MRQVFIALAGLLMTACASQVDNSFNQFVIKDKDRFVVLTEPLRHADDDKPYETVYSYASRLCHDGDFEYIGTYTSFDKTNVIIDGNTSGYPRLIEASLIECKSLPQNVRVVANGEPLNLQKGEVAVTIFNSSSDSLYSDGTGYVYISFDGYEFVKLPKKSHMSVVVPIKTSSIYIRHVDVWDFDGEGTVNLKEGINLLEVWASPFSTKFKQIQLPPEEQHKYSPYIIKGKLYESSASI